MEHLIELSIAMNDKDIADRIKEMATQKIWNEIYNDYFRTQGWNEEKVKTIIEKQVKDILTENKDFIIETAIEKLTKKISMSKAFTEQKKEVLNANR